MQPIAYRINDFARACGLSRTSTYELIKEGKLRAIRIAGRTLIPSTEVQRLIDEAQRHAG